MFLFDACEGVQQQMMRYGVSPSKMQAVFFSHLHADHILGIFGLMQSQNLMGRRDKMLIIGPKGTKAFFQDLFKHKPLSPQFPVEFKEASRECKVFENDLFAVTAFPVKHGGPALGFQVQCHSYRRFEEDKARKMGIKGRLFTELQQKGVLEVDGKKIKYEDVSYEQEGRKVVYSGDTSPCPSVAKHAKQADVLIHESTFSEEEKAVAAQKKHSTALQAATIAKKAKAKKLVLIHFSNRYEDRAPLLEEAKKEFAETIIAQEGMEIEV